MTLSEEQRRRLATAWRNRQRLPRIDRPAPKMPAPSRDPCPYCEVPGFRGCEHFLPFEPPKVKRRADGLEPATDRKLRGGQRGLGKWSLK